MLAFERADVVREAKHGDRVRVQPCDGIATELGIRVNACESVSRLQCQLEHGRAVGRDECFPNSVLFAALAHARRIARVICEYFFHPIVARKLQ